MKKVLILLFLISTINIFAGDPVSESRARGVFLSIGLGPRIPAFSFADKAQIGYNVEMEISYTDTKFLPFFSFAKIGYEHYSGSQDFYHYSDYSHYSKNIIPFTVGARYYFPPIFKNFVLVTPIVEVGATGAIYQDLSQFKSGAPDILENGFMPGLNLGVGVSMFLLEVTGTYNIYKDTHNLGFNIKLRLPMYVAL